jgi:hypothetical protein
VAALAVVPAFTMTGCCDWGLLSGWLGCSDLVAEITATPSAVAPGDTVQLSGRALNRDGSSYDRGEIRQIAWDYDGDGVADVSQVFEPAPEEGLRPTLFRDLSPPPPPEPQPQPFTQPGVYHPALMVVAAEEIEGPSIGGATQSLFIPDEILVRATARADVTVNAPPPAGDNQLPTASFTTSLSDSGLVLFNGSGSSDPDGTIDHYRWDFENDGTIDEDTGTTPTTSHGYPSEEGGNQTARLVVVDDDGGTGETTRTFYAPPHNPSAPGPGKVGARAAGTPPARPFTAQLSGDAIGRPRRQRTSGTVTRLRGARGAGRMRARLTPPRVSGDRALRGLLRARWRTRVNLSFDSSTLLARIRGVALTRSAGKGRKRKRQRGCVAFSVNLPAFGAPTGTLRLLGGRARLARLRVSGTYTAAVVGDGIELTGTAQSSRGKRRGLPRRCRTLR